MESELYKELGQLKKWRTAPRWDGQMVDDKLDDIKHEIITRGKITKSQIFQIGNLLNMAKKICQEHNRSYQQWVERSFDFSLKTAHNFVMFYQGCLAYPDIAQALPISSAYQVFSPSFPEEVKDLLQALPVKLNSREVPVIKQKYDEGGIEAVEEHLSRTTQLSTEVQTLQSYLKQFRDISKQLTDTNGRLYDRFLGKYYMDDKPETIRVGDSLHGEVFQAVEKLSSILDKCKKNLQTIKKELRDQA